jgi:hypothetical protein
MPLSGFLAYLRANKEGVMPVSSGKKAVFLGVIAFCLAAWTWPETMVGVRPAVTVEPDYPKGVFDVNLAPFCAEVGVAGSPFAVRADLVCTVQLGGKAPVVENVGFYLGVPWYPFTAGAERHSGFFVGPKVGLCRNLPGGFWSTGPSVELGWAFDFGDFALSACAEGGATVFLEEGEPPRLAGHGGLSCIAGFRF